MFIRTLAPHMQAVLDAGGVWCAHCQTLARPVYVHGHTQCVACHRVIDDCCQGEQAAPTAVPAGKVGLSLTISDKALTDYEDQRANDMAKADLANGVNAFD